MELQDYTMNSDYLILGANMSLNRTVEVMNKVASDNPHKFGYLRQVASHIEQIANVPVRNIGTIAGNLSIKHKHREFPSDLFVLFETVRAQLKIGHMNEVMDYSLESFLETEIMQRAQNTHAYVNAGFLMKVDKSSQYRVIDSPSIVFGGINTNFIHAKNAEDYLKGKTLLDINVLKEISNILKFELQSENDHEASLDYRTDLAVNLFYKFVLNLSPNSISSKHRSGGSLLTRPLSSGKQDFQSDKSMWPVNKPIPKVEAYSQCAGECEYINDIPIKKKELYGAFVLAKKGPGKLANIDTSPIQNMHGVVTFLSAKDIPGKNSFVEVEKIEDEELFAETEIKYAGQPVGVVIANSQTLANKAADKIIVNVQQIRKPVLDFKAVVESGDTSRIIKFGEKSASEKKKDIKYKFHGSLLLGGQYHFTMETQTCYCVPVVDGMDMYPSSQSITAVQHNAAAALNMPENSINVSVKRIGGGFGAKLNRSTFVSTACAVAAYNMQVPVRMVVKLETNMEAIGKRFPMYGKYEGAVNQKGEVQYLNIEAYINHGFTLNDSLFPDAPGIVKYIQSCYDSTTWKIIQYDVRTDQATNTYFRAPAQAPAIALIEHIMEHIAIITNLDPIEVRLVNLCPSSTSYIPPMIDEIKQICDFASRKASIETFNKENRWIKRGISLVTRNYHQVYFMLYHVLLSVYFFDGTVAISHGGVEMGQGINTKVIQACAYTLGIDMNMIKIKPTNNLVAPNDTPTGASMGSDGVTFAAIQCCNILLDRLEPTRKANPDKTWPELIQIAQVCSPSTSNHKLNYDLYGVTVSEVEIDLLTGQHSVLRVDMLEDVGQSLSPEVDIGQVEGAFVMGLGYWLTEKLIYDENTGALLTNRTWNYTPPGAEDIPIDFRVHLRRKVITPVGVLRSKATGELALCMSVSVVFAIRNALLSGRQNAGSKDEWFDLNLPYTPENVYLSSLTSVDQFAL